MYVSEIEKSEGLIVLEFQILCYGQGTIYKYMYDLNWSTFLKKFMIGLGVWWVLAVRIKNGRENNAHSYTFISFANVSNNILSTMELYTKLEDLQSAWTLILIALQSTEIWD